MALAEVFRASFVRKAAELGKPDVADHITAVTKKHTASLALAFAHFRVARPAQGVDEIAENLPGLGDALLRHQGVGALGASGRRKDRNSKHIDTGQIDTLYPH